MPSPTPIMGPDTLSSHISPQLRHSLLTPTHQAGTGAQEGSNWHCSFAATFLPIRSKLMIILQSLPVSAGPHPAPAPVPLPLMARTGAGSWGEDGGTLTGAFASQSVRMEGAQPIINLSAGQQGRKITNKSLPDWPENRKGQRLCLRGDESSPRCWRAAGRIGPTHTLLWVGASQGAPCSAPTAQYPAKLLLLRSQHSYGLRLQCPCLHSRPDPAACSLCHCSTIAILCALSN